MDEPSDQLMFRCQLAVWLTWQYIIQTITVDASVADRVIVFLVIGVVALFPAWLIGGFVAVVWNFVGDVTGSHRR